MRKLPIILLLILLSASLHAEAFYFKGYDANIDVAADGKMHIEEDMDLFFTDRSHGIIRDIQDKFEVDGRSFDPIIANVKNIESDDLYEVQSEDNFTSIVLGDPHKYLEGDANFKLSYDYDIGYDRNEDFDELYYNIVSAAWDCDMEEVRFSVTMPFAEGIRGIWVTSGSYSSENTVDYALSPDGRTITGVVKNLMPYQAVTIRVEMDEGYYQGQVIPADHTKLYCIIMTVVSLLVLGFVFVNFMKFGRDEKPVVYAQFTPPMNFNPIDVGYVLNGNIQLSREFVAMIFYWADKGLLKIEEQQVSKRKTNMIFHKVADITEEAKPYERKLFNALFPDDTIAVSMDQLSKSKFPIVAEHETLPEIENYYTKEAPLHEKKASGKANKSILLLLLLSIAIGIVTTLRYLGSYSMIISVSAAIYAFVASMVAESFYKGEFKSEGKIKRYSKLVIMVAISLLECIIITVYLSDITDIIFALLPAVSYTVTIMFGSFFALNTEKRTAFGQKALEGVLGYKEFIEYVEIDKLRVLFDQDPAIFYHTLSYAIALGLEEKWCKKFEDFIVPESDWFVGTAPIWSSLYYSNLQHKLIDSYNRNIMPRAVAVSGGGGNRSSFSGSSGFAGGGFSGGGGRSW